MFAPDLVNELPGAAWLRDWRTTAAKLASECDLPTFESEEWRYSPIDDFDPGLFAPALAPPEGATRLDTAFDAVALAARVETLDGFVVSKEVSDSNPGGVDGLVVESAADLSGSWEREHHDDAFGLANEAFCPHPVIIRVAPGTTIDDPIMIVHRSREPGTAVFPQVLIELGDDAEASVVEVFTSADVASLVVSETNVKVGDAARFKYQQVQTLGREMWHIGRVRVEVGSQASFGGALTGLGGGYARVRTDCRLLGRGASGDLAALYYANGNQTLDYRTFQTHVGRDTQSNLLFKGVVDDDARSIYTGLIEVGTEAAGSNAFQTNRTIKLSDRAWAESVPNLQIENNDVRCSHASTVSPVDPEQLFYLESRGVPSEVAERLIVEGFLHEVTSRLPVAAINELLDAMILARIGHVDGR